MAHADTRTPANEGDPGPASERSVLVILVSRDGERWLRPCLLSLASQTHPRIGVLAVDNASTDGTRALLEQALGRERVLALPENRGFTGAAAAALATEAAAAVDYVLLLHDDTVLEPDAVAHLVEAAVHIEGVGIVGPKVVDADRPEMLREVGESVDRFGYAYAPLEAGELDHGQYDRVREVLAVSSCAMLVARETVERVGLPDERLISQYGDLDYCWRARIAGFRVLMAPLAIARHRGVGIGGERPAGRDAARARYQRERAAMVAVLKNYGLVSLAWILPAWLLQGALRTLVLLLTRRLEDGYQMMAALGWNLAHLPGTVVRRRRVQRVRRVRDHRVHQFMAPASVRLRRWVDEAARLLGPTAEEEGEGPAPLRRRAAGMATAHPFLVAWVLGIAVLLVADRHLFGLAQLYGGAVAAFPAGPAAFFRELASGVRTTGLGGTTAASPALALLGAGSAVALGDSALLQKLLIVLLPAAAAVSAYRAARAEVDEPVPAIVAAALYALSPVVLWSASEGRVPELVFLAGLPWVARRLTRGFDAGPGVRPVRWAVGAGAGLAVIGAFFPGEALAAAVILLAAAVASPRGAGRARGLGLAVGAAAAAALLVFPLTLDLVRGGGAGLAGFVGTTSFSRLARLDPGPAPGAWPAAFLLPVGAVVGFVVAAGEHRRGVGRALLAALASIYLAWLAASGRLPLGVSNPVAYLGVAAYACAVLVAAGLASLARGVSRAAFGYRQVGGSLLVLLAGGGLVLQGAAAATGGWAIGGPTVMPPALPALAAGAPYRILWIGDRFGGALTAPGGVPDGIVSAGPASVRFAVTGPSGASALDTGRPSAGPGYDALGRALQEILAGPTHHGGALLAPFGIRYVVATRGDLPPAARARLAGQLDLDLVPSPGLVVLEDPVAAPVRAVTANPTWRAAAASGAATGAAELQAPSAVQLAGTGGEARSRPGVPAGAVALLSEQYAPGWRLVPSGGGSSPAAFPAFGWAVGFRVPAGTAAFVVRYGRQWVRTLEIAALAALWIVVLWFTRRPVRGG